MNVGYQERQGHLQDDDSGGYSFAGLVFGAISEARRAKADGNESKYWSLFCDILQYLTPHIPEEDRMLIEKDWRALEKYEQEQEAKVSNGELHIDSMKAEVMKARMKFCKDKTYYINMAIPRSGLYKKEDEGIIKFEEGDMPYDMLTTIIRAKQGGTPSRITNVLDKKLPGDNYVKKPKEEDGIDYASGL